MKDQISKIYIKDQKYRLNFLFLIFIFEILSLVFYLDSVSAHVLKSDGSIGAVIHIDPEDDPIAGQESTFYFDFKDTQGKFTPAQCDCLFSIIQGGKEIFSQSLFQDDPNVNKVSVAYTFPEQDIYQVKVSGKPNATNAFEPFVLTYDIRVERVTDKQIINVESGLTSWITSHLVQLIGGGIFLGIGVWLFSKKQVK